MQNSLLVTVMGFGLCLLAACGKDIKPDEAGAAHSADKAGGPRYADPTEAQAVTRQCGTVLTFC